MAYSLILLLSLALTLLTIHHSAAQDERQAYIVYMGDMPKDEVSKSPLHLNLLQKVIDSHTAAESLLRSYKRSFNGFAAKLTKNEAQKLARMEGVVSVFPNRKKKLHTTRSWDFIGFPQKVKRSTIESDVIIGMLDSGIWPESSSFDDKGFGPPPSKWKGTCEAPSNFTCNNKIIGAKYYRTVGTYGKSDFKSPRDSEGHGTHTASTAAGAVVGTASLSGLGHGTARGGVPSARLAVYKVCWSEDCYDVDILAAFDDAIADGVDIISLSVGGFDPDNYFTNVIAIGAFHAVRKGILTSVSVGNHGPILASITNFTPWALSVAASTIDRQFFTKIQLGDHKIYEGISINIFGLNNKAFPLIYGADAPNKTKDEYSSRYCETNTLDKNLVKGKIVFCDGFAYRYGEEAFRAGAAGAVLQGRIAGEVVDSFPLPLTYLSSKHAAKIYMYMNSTRKPIASIWKSTEVRNRMAPYIPTFSSRGPNPISPNILKPDLAAPGAQILAAWSPVAPISFVGGDKRTEAYNIITGTSMACPHASAAAAYVKSFHPKWSPAAIKSSLMTTGKGLIRTGDYLTTHPMSSNLNPEAEFAYGAGQINPVKALSPGLVYDVEETDYVKFLCEQGYDAKRLQIISGDKSSCSSSEEINGSARDLNYPAFSLSVSPSESINHVFRRTMTNVGSPNSTYKASLTAPEGLKVTVNPSVLSFTYKGQKLSYTLKVKGTVDTFVASASLVWDDDTFQVRSPIAIYLEY